MNQKMDFLTFFIASIREKPGRNLATIFCFAFVAANIFSGQYLIAGTVRSIDQGKLRMGADLLVVPPLYEGFLQDRGPENTFAIVRVESSKLRLDIAKIQYIEKIPGVLAISPQLYVSTLVLPELSSAPIDIFGIDPATDFTIQPWLSNPLSHPLGPREVIVGDAISGEESSQISVKGYTYTIAGRLDPTRSAIDNTIFLGLDEAYIIAEAEGVVPISDPRIKQGDISGALIHVAPGANPDMVGALIKQPSPYITVIKKHFTLDPVLKDIEGLPVILSFISAVVVCAALLLIALIGMMVAHERRREIGLLRSLGAKRTVIFFLQMTESLVLAVIGGIAGIGASFTILFLLNMQGFLNNALQVTFRMPATNEIGIMAGITVGIVIIIASISSLYPAYRSSTMSPYDAIRSEW